MGATLDVGFSDTFTEITVCVRSGAQHWQLVFGIFRPHSLKAFAEGGCRRRHTRIRVRNRGMKV